MKQLIVNKFLDEDKSKARISNLFDLNWFTVNCIIERYLERGTLENLPRGGRIPANVKLKEEHTEYNTNILDEDSQLTIGIMKEKLPERFPNLQEIGISLQQLHKHIYAKVGFTLKRTKPVEEKRNTPDTIKSRFELVNMLQELGISYKTNCVFVDEADFNFNLIRGRSWPRKGEDAVVKTKSKRAINIIILAAISYQGVEDVTAKMVPGGTDSELLLQYIKQVVASLDKVNAAPHYFIMDNATIHTSNLVKVFLNLK